MLIQYRLYSSLILSLVAVALTVSLQGQQIIDGAYAFQSNPTKKYALYVPSGYHRDNPSKAILALHPYNTSRWNASTWRDKLIDFAEMNNVILICPDGDADGKIDDPIDTAFTSSLIDSAFHWYNIDRDKLFIMGFSWGGRTTYTYGLRRAHKFAGFIPMSPAINGIGLFDAFLSRARDKPFYLICGSKDNPAQRFYAPRDALKKAGALVNDSLLMNIGHTVDYGGSTRMFDIAFDWIDSMSTKLALSVSPEQTSELKVPRVFPNPARSTQWVSLSSPTRYTSRYRLFTLQGALIEEQVFRGHCTLPILSPGTYLLQIEEQRRIHLHPLVILP